MPRKKTPKAQSLRPHEKQSSKPSQLRVIGGDWRSRKVVFNAWEGLRPTPDRVRETLFNWLNFDISGRTCLDLYAGTGILGIEALSRGAKSVIFVDSSTHACHQLTSNMKLLTENCPKSFHINQGDVQNYLNHPPPEGGEISLIFADPPFNKRMIDPLILTLDKHNWLSPGALIYLEFEEGFNPGTLPEGWELLKQKKAGQVIFSLYRKN